MENVSSERAIKKLRLTAALQKIAGWPMALFAGLVTILGLVQIHETTDAVMTALFAAFTAVGVLLIASGRKKGRLIRTYREYSARLSGASEASLDMLASNTGAQPETVARNIHEMISRGLLTGFYIDTRQNRLVRQGPPPGTQAAASAPPETEYITVTCKNCGAANRIAAGSAGECEYCGSEISG